jgi:hypothetical protein
MIDDIKVNETGSANAETETGAEETKTYTQEEVDALLQSEVDRRITSALKKQQQKNEAKMREATKLAQMTEEQKRAYELDQREQAIAEKEREFALLENKATASQILADKGIDASLVDFIVAEDAETTNNNINLLERAFKKSVKAEVEKRLAGSTPKKGLPIDKAITKEQFMKMSYTELLALKQENPEVYEALSK